MNIEIKNGQIVITAPLALAPTTSSTGKSLLLASTNGFLKTGLTHNGKLVSVSLNVIVPNK